MHHPRTTPRNPLIGAAVRARQAEAQAQANETLSDEQWPTTQSFPRQASNAADFQPPTTVNRQIAEFVIRALVFAAIAAPAAWHLIARSGL